FGNIWLVEDVGGTLFGFAKNPNSFVYRFVPTNSGDLTQGKLEALQVFVDGQPVIFHPEGDTLSQTQLKLHIDAISPSHGDRRGFATLIGLGLLPTDFRRKDLVRLISI